MTHQDYYFEAANYVFRDWDHIPLLYQRMVEIVSSQFFYHNTDLDSCVEFCTLILKIRTKGTYADQFEYEPFKDLYADSYNEDLWNYEFNPEVVSDKFFINLNNGIRIEADYRDHLNYDGLLCRIKAAIAKQQEEQAVKTGM